MKKNCGLSCLTKKHGSFYLRAIMAGLTFACAGAGYAGTTLINLSGGANWQSTTDGLVANQWNLGNVNPNDGIAAFAPYSNTATTTLNSNSMMWYCNPATTNCPTQAQGGGGPNEAFFVRQFTIKPGATTSGSFAIIADDYLRLQVNGQFIFDALLTDNLSGGQPVPLIFDINGFDLSLESGTVLDLSPTLTGVLHDGTNTFLIQAMDGTLMSGLFSIDECLAASGRPISQNRCFNNSGLVNEYAFIQGSVSVVPEPGSIALVGVSLAGLAAMRRRKAPNQMGRAKLIRNSL